MRRLLVSRIIIILVLMLGFAPPRMAQQTQPLPGAIQPGQLPPGMGQPGQLPPGMEQPGQAPPGTEQPGQAPSGMGQPGQLPSGMGQPGQLPPGMGQPGQLPPGMEQPGQAPPGTAQPEPPPPETVQLPSEPSPAVPALSPIEQLIAGRIPGIGTPLRQFGYDLFAPGRLAPGPSAEGRFGGPVGDLRFAPPTTDVPVGPDYVIGPGDSLNIVLWGGVEDVYHVEVNRNGAIVLPRLGVVQVWGMTLAQLERLLRQRFGQYYPDFQMAVTLGRLRTIRVYLVGEVNQPGAYTVSSLSTIINALFVSGGPSKNGSLRHIRLLRQGKVIHTLDLYDFLLQGDKSQDQTLQSGDTIFVPVIGPVAGVAGNVHRPAIYEIKPDTSLQRLLELAGGVTPLGYLQRVQVERFVAHERKVVVDLDLSAPAAKTASLWQTRIANGDLVSVFPIVTTLSNVVQLEGHVLRPGRYELKPGMRLRDLVPSYDVLLPEPYLDYAEIIRLVEPDLRPIIVPFNLGALLAGDTASNRALQPRDTVRIFARADFVDPHLVRISGLVHRPGIYLLTPGMRVRDLVFQAQNVHKFAYLEKAELTRQMLGATGHVAVRLDINLRQALAGDPEHNLLLQDFDHLLVRQVPGVTLQLPELGSPTAFFPLQDANAPAVAVMRRAGIVQERTMALRGEVRFPGNYPIQAGEHLSSVLRRAGGFTNQAYLRGAVFTRESVRLDQEKRLQELLREEEQAVLAQSAAGAAAALSPEEVQGQRQELVARRELLERLRAVRPEGRVVLRLQALEAFAGSEQDIELEPGDNLRIPQTPEYVSVLGQVYNRTALLYEPGRSVAFYLERVGGIRKDANEKEIYLVQADGTVVSNTQNQYATVLADGQTTYMGDFFDIQPQPGDAIIVPRRIKSTAGLRTTRDIVQIVFQGLSSIGIIAAILR
jgi:protein involved in polysaccharide export with SLBB domain